MVHDFCDRKVQQEILSLLRELVYAKNEYEFADVYDKLNEIPDNDEFMDYFKRNWLNNSDIPKWVIFHRKSQMKT